MFKALAFRSLCLVPNKIDFVLSWLKCTLKIFPTILPEDNQSNSHS